MAKQTKTKSNDSSFNSYNFFEKTYTVNEVLDFYTSELTEKDYDGNMVKMNSQRYQTFLLKGTKCKCGREGTIFRLQRSNNSKGRYHFGLWSEDNYQMTKDHIIPASLGGSNSIDNYTTMCEKCNFEKGNACTVEDIQTGKAIDDRLIKPQANIGATHTKF